MVGRHHADLAVARQFGPVHIGQNLRIGAEIQDLPLGGARHGVLFDRHRAAQDGRDFRQRRQVRRQLGHRRGLALQLQAFFRHGDEFDHARIGLLRRVAHGENAMLQQDQAFGFRMLVEHIGHRLGQRETGDGVGHIGDTVAIDFLHQRLVVGLVGQRQHGGGMDMVDEFVRQEGVQQGFDRRVRRGGIQQIDALEVDHVLVGQLVQLAQLAQRLQPHRRQARRFDHAHVPARALDADHIDIFAELVFHDRLDRGIAAAMQHHFRIAAEQACGVGAHRQVFVHALGGVIGGEFLGVGVRPLGLHGTLSFGKEAA